MKNRPKVNYSDIRINIYRSVSNNIVSSAYGTLSDQVFTVGKRPTEVFSINTAALLFVSDSTETAEMRLTC